MITRVLTLFLAVMAVAGVVGATEAYGCSCVYVEADEMVAGAEAAFEGTVISSEELPVNVPEGAPRPPDGPIDIRFKVERVFKGSLGDEVTVRTNGSGASCGLGRLEPGTRHALVLDRDDEGRWQGSLCGQFDPDELSNPGRPPSLQPATLARLARPSPISAWRRIAVWSAYDEDAGAYRLMVADGDAVGPLPVDPSPVPFDADVGPDSSGEPAVVYSRCAQVPEPPLERPGADCDLFILGLRDNRGERPIANASSEGSEFEPTLWRGDVAWVRTYPGRAGEPFLYTRPLVAPRERRSQQAPGAPPGSVESPRVEELELYGRRLAVDATYAAGATRVNQLRLADLRERTSRLLAGVDGGPSGRDYVGVSVDAGRVAWYLTCGSATAGCAAEGGAWRYGIATGDRERGGDIAALAGFAWTLGGSYRVSASEPSATRTGPLDWRSPGPG